jgi:alkylation response protein AidB-like acyl-CoA dehydrogenase
VPAAGQTVLRHCLADPENIAFVACPGPRPQGTPVQAEIGRHLGAVRIGLLRRALDLVVEGLAERSAGGEALLKKQLVLGDIAGVLAGAELARSLAWSRPDPGAVADLHRGLDELGWQVAKLAGAAGYLHDHPVRVLYAAALVANTWVGRVPALEPVP